MGIIPKYWWKFETTTYIYGHLAAEPQKGNFILQPLIFRGDLLVSGRVYNPTSSNNPYRY